MPLTIWTNQPLSIPAEKLLRDTLSDHRLLISERRLTSNVHPPQRDPKMGEADVAFGQPHVEDLEDATNLRLVQLSSAGYTRYDHAEIKANLQSMGTALCNASGVYADPCAHHALAMLLSDARQLPQTYTRPGEWRPAGHRAASRLLTGQTILIAGYGAIGQRLARLLQPFEAKVFGFRRTPKDDQPFADVRAIDEIDTLLPKADAVVNILPAHPSTVGFIDVARLARLTRDAVYVSIGRGDTTDQPALMDALAGNRLRAAYLDVTTPEPLPADDPLWKARNCYISPHTAGGTGDEFERLVHHLAQNVKRLQAGQPLIDRIV